MRYLALLSAYPFASSVAAFLLLDGRRPGVPRTSASAYAVLGRCRSRPCGGSRCGQVLGCLVLCAWTGWAVTLRFVVWLPRFGCCSRFSRAGPAEWWGARANRGCRVIAMGWSRVVSAAAARGWLRVAAMGWAGGRARRRGLPLRSDRARASQQVRVGSYCVGFSGPLWTLQREIAPSSYR